MSLPPKVVPHKHFHNLPLHLLLELAHAYGRLFLSAHEGPPFPIISKPHGTLKRSARL